MLSGSISISSTWSQTPTNVPGALPVRTQQTLAWTVTGGTGADQADQKFALKRSLVASTPLVINLLTDLVDGQGVPFVPARVKSISGVNRSQTPGQVVEFGFATTTANAHAGIVSNPGQLAIRPSTAANPGSFAFVAPDADGYLVDATHKLIQFDPGAVTIPLEIEIVCSSV